MGPNYLSGDTTLKSSVTTDLSSQATSIFFAFHSSFPCEPKSISAATTYPGSLIPLTQPTYSIGNAAHICNPSTWMVGAGGSRFKISLAYVERLSLKKKDGVQWKVH